MTQLHRGMGGTAPHQNGDWWKILTGSQFPQARRQQQTT
jgi:hypothetical protein